MKQIKYIPNLYSYMDACRMERRLEHLAKKGWFLEIAEAAFWICRRGEPKKLHYRIVFDPDVNAQNGWQCVCSADGLQIFCTEADDPAPIAAEPTEELDRLHKCVKKRDRILWLGMMLLSAVLLAVKLIAFKADPVEVLADGPGLAFGLVMVLLLIYGLFSMIHYSLWRSRAKKQIAAAGTFQARSGHWICGLIAVVLAAALIVLQVLMDAPYGRIVTGMDYISWLLLAVAFIMALTITKRRQMKRSARNGVIVTVMVATALFVGAAQAMLLDLWKPADTAQDLYLTVSHLQDTENMTHYYAVENQSSPLLEDLTGFHRASTDTEEWSLQYRITKVKVASLQELCRENCLPASLQGEVTAQDAKLWQAENVWLSVTGNGKYIYYIYYADRTVTLMFNWEPSQEQIATAAQLMKNA